MLTRYLMKLSTAALIAIALTGCKIYVANYEGGTVVSELGTCFEGRTCI